MVNLSPAKFIGTTVEEGKKVIWPNRELVIRHTVMVVVTIGIGGLIFVRVDFGFKKLVILAIK